MGAAGRRENQLVLPNENEIKIEIHEETSYWNIELGISGYMYF